MADNPVPAEQQNSASVPAPSDPEIPYTVDAGGKPTITNKGGTGLPGHKLTVDGAAVRAEAAARYNAEAAAAKAKSDAQFRADTGASRPKFTPAPRKGK